MFDDLYFAEHCGGADTLHQYQLINYSRALKAGPAKIQTPDSSLGLFSVAEADRDP